MKIGILTYHAPCNFGANLQAYCSMRYLQSLGHDVKIINYVSPEYQNQLSCQEMQREAHWHFCQNTLNTTRLISEGGQYLYALVKEENFDTIMIGSDAVWNYSNLEDFKVYHADWLWNTDLADKIRVISLSPAFMGQTYENLCEDDKAGFAKSLRRFSYLTTRDTWTKDVINREILGEELIKTVNPDPVFLLDDLCNDKWIVPNDIKSKGYYIMSLPPNFAKVHSGLNKRWFESFKKIVNKRGYMLVELPLPEGTTGLPFDYTVPYPIDPLQWFLWLKNAKGFIGLRFHAVVSCISACTPFYSLDIYGRSTSRIISLLNKFGFHKLDHKYNKSSKIRNILDGSGLENYRMNGDAVSMICPRSLLRKMETYDMDSLILYKKEMKDTFKSNIEVMLSSYMDSE